MLSPWHLDSRSNTLQCPDSADGMRGAEPSQQMSNDSAKPFVTAALFTSVRHVRNSKTKDAQMPLSIRVGRDISVKDRAGTISKVVDCKGCFDWDRPSPDGAPRELLDNAPRKAAL